MAAISAVVAALSLTNTGCIGIKQGINLGPFAIPIPVSPYFQKMQEDKFWNHERYERAPVLGPIVPGGPMIALDPPSDDEVVRAWEKANAVQGGYPFLHEKIHNNVRIVKDKIADYVDPPDMIAESVVCGPDADRHAENVRQFVQAGYDEVYVQQVGSDHEGFFRGWREHVLPEFR